MLPLIASTPSKSKRIGPGNFFHPRVEANAFRPRRYTIPYVLTTKLEKPIIPLPQFANQDAATFHVAPNPKILKLSAVQDPLERSGYARLSLFPAATKKLYPKEFAKAHELGLM